MTKPTVEEIYNDTEQCMGLCRDELNPGPREGTIGRAAIAWLLMHTMKYSRAEAAYVMGWETNRSIDYMLKRIKSTEFDGHKRIGGSTMLGYCEGRHNVIMRRHERKPAYGHTPE